MPAPGEEAERTSELLSAVWALCDRTSRELRSVRPSTDAQASRHARQRGRTGERKTSPMSGRTGPRVVNHGDPPTHNEGQTTYARSTRPSSIGRRRGRSRGARPWPRPADAGRRRCLEEQTVRLGTAAGRLSRRGRARCVAAAEMTAGREVTSIERESRRYSGSHEQGAQPPFCMGRKAKRRLGR